MKRRWRRILLATLALVLVAAAVALWAFWPLIIYFRGEPVLYTPGELGLQRVDAPIAIVGGTLIDGRGGPPLENAAIVIRGRHVAAVTTAADARVPPGAIRIDASGGTVLPGLIDMHVHLYKGDDLALFLAAGVTSVRDVGNFTDIVAGLAHRIRSGAIVGPRIFYSGESFIHENGFAIWQRPTADAAFARAEVKKRIAAGASVIKIVADITPELAEAIVDEAHRANVPVSADILGNGRLTAAEAIAIGVDGLEHVSGVPQAIAADAAPTRFSEPVSTYAMLGWMYADERKEAALIQSMVDRGTYVVPTFSVMRMMFPEDVPVPFDSAQRHVSKRIRGFWTGVNRIPALSSAADRAFENAFLVHYAYSQPFVRKLDAAGGRIVAGTDEPTPGLVPGFSLHGELELLVRAGLTPMRAIQAATQTAADFLRRSHELGTIQPGKLADIIVVDGQPHVRIDDIRRVRTVVSDGILINPVGILSAAAAR